MNHTGGAIAARIKIPAEAVLPLIVGLLVFAALVFGSSALARWKAASPRAAVIAGIVAGFGLAAFVVYRLIVLVPQVEANSRVYEGVELVTLLDGPIVAFVAAMAVAAWRFANQRAVALLVGTGAAIALIAKPFIAPLVRFDSGKPWAYDLMDLEHLGFTGGGIVLLLATLAMVAYRARRNPAVTVSGIPPAPASARR